jgi:hypothetical protein
MDPAVLPEAALEQVLEVTAKEPTHLRFENLKSHRQRWLFLLWPARMLGVGDGFQVTKAI